MARASGSRWQPSYVTESSLGVPSGPAFTKTRLLLASGLEQRRSNLQSQQAVGDRSVAPGRLGNKSGLVIDCVCGSVSCECFMLWHGGCWLLFICQLKSNCVVLQYYVAAVYNGIY